MPQSPTAAKLSKESELQSASGLTLEQHWENGRAVKEIQNGNWDVVVLQEQSQRPVSQPKLFQEYASKFDAEVRKKGGRTVLLAINDQGLRRSDDGGRTWVGLALPDGKPASLAASADGGAIYIGTTEGLVRSDDGGATWSPTGLAAIAVALAVSPLDPSIVTVVDDRGRFFRSFDGGRSWPGPGQR
mgnify:CR=1 FL=1